MISSLLRLASLACTAVVVLSFAMFAAAQAQGGEKETIAKLGDATPSAADTRRTSVDEPSPDPRTERRREEQHSSAREVIDDADDALLAPFKGIAGSGSIWTLRIVEGFLALLVFGAGLGFAGRYAATRGA